MPSTKSLRERSQIHEIHSVYSLRPCDKSVNGVTRPLIANKNTASHRRRRRLHGISQRTNRKSIALRIRHQILTEPNTPFNVHLQKIYTGEHGPDDGLQYFQNYGYYDSFEANVVQLFREAGQCLQSKTDAKRRPTHSESHKQFISRVRQKLIKKSKETAQPANPFSQMTHKMRAQEILRLFGSSSDISFQTQTIKTHSTRNSIEMSMNERMRNVYHEALTEDFIICMDDKSKSLKAAEKIKKEKQMFMQNFDYAFIYDLDYENGSRNSDCSNWSEPQEYMRHPLPIPPFAISIPLPPYQGYLYMLRQNIPLLLRSWQKRYFCLDFLQGKLFILKRSYWKSIKCVLDLRDVERVARINSLDLQLEFVKECRQSALLLRSANTIQANLWANLIQYARRQIRCTFTSGVPSLEIAKASLLTVKMLSAILEFSLCRDRRRSVIVPYERETSLCIKSLCTYRGKEITTMKQKK